MNEFNEGVVITSDVVKEARKRFEDYKASKKQLDQRIVQCEQVWKMLHWKQSKEKKNPTGWLLNTCHSKHADMMDGFPEANIRAQEESDVSEAKTLSEIVPVILRREGFKQVYSKACRDKITKGTGLYGIFWDSRKNFGKGDISIKKINLLNFFYEPEFEDIQQSKEVFLVAKVDREALKDMYPRELEGKSLSSYSKTTEKYENEEAVNDTDKVAVFDWYYKKQVGNKTVLHYCKFVDDIVLYASEDDTAVPTMPMVDMTTGEPLLDEAGNVMYEEIGSSRAETGWYEHGEYPFVADVMFPTDNSPFGWGYIDIFGGTQEDIDVLNHAIIKNAVIGAKPRYFVPKSAGVNTDDFADLEKDMIFVDGTTNDIKQIEPPVLPSLCVEVMNNKIGELKEVSGNRDVNNGSSSAGITAASAIAALQEEGGKTSRDNLQSTYDAFERITYQVIELIRQFYDTERTFRIVGELGQEEFRHWSNANIKPQDLGSDFGVDFGYRIPQFDIVVSAQKATAYSKLSQNEFALQLYQAGMFHPQNADVALATVQMMDFNGKDKVLQTIERNGTMMQKLQTIGQIALGLASKNEPGLVPQLAMMLGINPSQSPAATALPKGEPGDGVDTDIKEANADGTLNTGEHHVVEKARKRSQESTQVS